jgi:hypothetical protein
MSFSSRLALALVLVACGDDGNDGSDTAASMSASDGTTADTMPTSDGSASVGSDDDGPSDTSMVPTEASASSDDDASSGNDTATTGGGAFVPCTKSSSDCGEGMACRLAECCDDIGFCVPDDARTCGGFIGMACPGGLSCVLDACVADGSGPCVDPEIAAALQAEQPECWTAG